MSVNDGLPRRVVVKLARSMFGGRERFVFLVLILLLAVVVPATGASAAPTWAPAAGATIRPGVSVVTGPSSCTSNFVFYDDDYVYLGQAAHCSTTGSATELNGCTAPSLPLDTPVTVEGATKPGTLVYNSWITMQALAKPIPTPVCTTTSP